MNSPDDWKYHQSNDASPIFKIFYRAESPDPLRLGEDRGLNRLLLDALSAERREQLSFIADVFESQSCLITSDWGYVTNGGGLPDIALMLSLGWSPEHFTHIIQEISSRKNQLPPKLLDDPAVNILWPGIMTYGHWLIDTIARLELMIWSRPEARDYTILLPEGAPSYMREIVNAFGFFKVLEVGWSGVMCKKVYSPGHTRRACSFPRNLYASAFDRMRGGRLSTKLNPGVTKKDLRTIFVKHTPQSASDEDAREIDNVGDVLQTAAACGFKPFDPLETSFTEQVSVFENVKSVVGVDSSALHGLVFARPGNVTNLFVICVPWRYNYNHYLVASLTGARLHLIPSKVGSRIGSCTVDPSALHAVLRYR